MEHYFYGVEFYVTFTLNQIIGYIYRHRQHIYLYKTLPCVHSVDKGLKQKDVASRLCRHGSLNKIKHAAYTYIYLFFIPLRYYMYSIFLRLLGDIRGKKLSSSTLIDYIYISKSDPCLA